MKRVLRVHDVERGVSERELFGVGDGKGEARPLAPGSGRFHVNRDHLSHALTQQACDSTVTAAGIEERFVTAERVLELVDAADAVSELAVRGCFTLGCGAHRG